MPRPPVGVSLRLITSFFIVLGSACASNLAQRSNAPVRAPFAPLLAPEIGSTAYVTAYDAVEGLRHEFLTMPSNHSRGAALVAETIVYVNGTRFGGLALLKSIPANQVASIRLLKATDATIAYGPGLSGGAILVETVRTRRP